MGKATVDLPDPLDRTSSDGKSASNADDLLSQLAGDEIDRLLAEAEVEPRPQGTPRPAGADVSKDTNDEAEVDAEIEAGIDAVMAELTREQDAATPAPAPTPSAPARAPEASVSSQDATADQELNSQLDALFDELNKPLDNQTVEPAPKSTEESKGVAESPGAMKDAAQTTPDQSADAGPKDADAETSEAEHAALAAVTDESDDADDADDAPAAALQVVDEMVASDEAAQEEARADAVPIVLKPLVWLNAPLLSAPEWIREAVGKVAILTLINAVAVLVYVLLFRAK
ncbi:MAG: hypothetical protein ACREIT_05285 [Tepidisphaeraceae bacterium]